MSGFVQIRSLSLLSLVLLGTTSATVLGAADKVWFDEKAVRLEMQDKFNNRLYIKVRDDVYYFNNVVTTVTETDGMQMRFQLYSRRDYKGTAHMFLEFDKKGMLSIAKAIIAYGGKSYTAKPVFVSALLGIERKESKLSLSEKVANALQVNIKELKITQKGNVRTPDFASGARYMTVMVGKNVWFGPKVIDHRTGSGGTHDHRGEEPR